MNDNQTRGPGVVCPARLLRSRFEESVDGRQRRGFLITLSRQQLYKHTLTRDQLTCGLVPGGEENEREGKGEGVCIQVDPESACGKSRERRPHRLKWQHTRLFRREENRGKSARLKPAGRSEEGNRHGHGLGNTAPWLWYYPRRPQEPRPESAAANCSSK